MSKILTAFVHLVTFNSRGVRAMSKILTVFALCGVLACAAAANATVVIGYTSSAASADPTSQGFSFAGLSSSSISEGAASDSAGTVWDINDADITNCADYYATPSPTDANLLESNGFKMTAYLKVTNDTSGINTGACSSVTTQRQLLIKRFWCPFPVTAAPMTCMWVHGAMSTRHR